MSMSTVALQEGQKPAVRLGELCPELPLNADLGALPIRRVVSDSRKATADSLFCALLPAHPSGQPLQAELHRERLSGFARSAIGQGATVVLSQIALTLPETPDVPVIVVPDLPEWVGLFARRCLQAHHPVAPVRVAAVTGTNGKTTICRLLAELLTLAGHKTAVLGTTGNGILPALTPSSHTTLDAVTLQEYLHEFAVQGAEFACIEASSHGLDQGRLQGTPIEVAIFSNLTRDHLDYHQTMAHYAAAKARLFDPVRFPSLASAIVNADDPQSAVLTSHMPDTLPAWRYSQQANGGAEFRVVDAEYQLTGAVLTIETPDGPKVLNSPLLGKFNVSNLLAAVAAARALGLSWESVQSAVPQLQGAPGRMQVVDDPDRLLVVDYAHTPDALQQVLSSLRPHTAGQLRVVFGCGGDRDRGKRPLMTEIALNHADHVLLTSDNPRSEPIGRILDDMIATLDESQLARIQVQQDRRMAIRQAVSQAKVGDVVVVAGKGHEDYQEIEGVRHWFDDVVELRQAQTACLDDASRLGYAATAFSSLAPSGALRINPMVSTPSPLSPTLPATNLSPMTLPELQADVAPWNPDTLQQATGGVWQGDLSQPISAWRIQTDTRAIQPGDIFLALKGERFDGHQFALQAIAKGAVAILVSETLPTPAPQLVVSDTRLALGQLGQYHRLRMPDLSVVALTGSSGKTTTKEMLGSIVSLAGPTLMTRGNLNNDLGVPMMLLELMPSHRYAVMELGANHRGEIAYTTQLVQPQVAAVLNIGTAHLGEFGGREGIAHAKSEIFQGLSPTGIAVLPRQVDYSEILQEAAQNQPILEWGDGAEVCASDIELLPDSSRFVLNYQGAQQPIQLPFAGRHNVDNALAAASMALALGMTMDIIARGLASATTIKGRLVFHRKNGMTLIDDTYNANPHSVLAAAKVLSTQAGQRYLLLGDIAELGEESRQEHYRLGTQLAALPLAGLLCVGEFAPDTVAGAQAHGMAAAQAFENKEALLAQLQTRLSLCSDPLAVLIKGSRSARMETLVDALLEKS